MIGTAARPTTALSAKLTSMYRNSIEATVQAPLGVGIRLLPDSFYPAPAVPVFRRFVAQPGSRLKSGSQRFMDRSVHRDHPGWQARSINTRSLLLQARRKDCRI